MKTSQNTLPDTTRTTAAVRLPAPAGSRAGDRPGNPSCPGDEAQERTIAHAVWTEIHWLMPRGRTVTITVEGDRISVALDPQDEIENPTAH